MKQVALYAGSFDPITNGHIDIIERTATLFDEVIIAISYNTTKNNLFNQQERMQLAKDCLAHLDNVCVIEHTGGLTVDLAEQLGATVLVRGIRNTVDFEYESNIATLNKTQNDKIETIIFLANEQYRFVSSSMIKEIAQFGGVITQFVPELVEQAIKAKFQL
ncbi:Phosphopantetheine adenylyltransferase [Granulicatella balaenopterae]|uniref:Phosphopantetheine adenylyltransferase n=2 Tax=Granulicatella balaenopterae TaxID=137733 RepID=A0A1H9IAP0_9LACT|nr:Phosphopantetheine adenylyltransferase [Granulicatella balaenopterae]